MLVYLYQHRSLKVTRLFPSLSKQGAERAAHAEAALWKSFRPSRLLVKIAFGMALILDRA